MSTQARSPGLRRGLAAFALACMIVPALPAQEPGVPAAAPVPSSSAPAESARLERMRAGSAGVARSLSVEERAALERAEASAPALAAMRAGGLHLTEEELRLVLITAGVVIILAILI